MWRFNGKSGFHPIKEAEIDKFNVSVDWQWISILI